MRQLLPTGTPLLERLEFASIPEPNSGCRLWLAGTWGGGYGRISVDGIERPAHVVAWELYKGRSAPQGLHICHKCDVKPCIEESHLFPGTRSDNMADMHKKGRANKPSRHGRNNRYSGANARFHTLPARCDRLRGWGHFLTGQPWRFPLFSQYSASLCR